MYENLLCLPYFQGMSKDDITAILDKVTFDFVKYGDGEFICHKNENCDKFLILVQGKMNVMTEAPDNSYRLTEDIVAPFAIAGRRERWLSICGGNEEGRVRSPCGLAFSPSSLPTRVPPLATWGFLPPVSATHQASASLLLPFPWPKRFFS